MSTSSIPTNSGRAACHTTPGSLAAALRELADQIDTCAYDAIAETWLSVGLQVTHSDASDELRGETVQALAAAFGAPTKYDRSSGHYGADRNGDTYRVHTYGAMRPPGNVLDELIDEAYAEEAQRFDDRKAYLDQIDEWMLRHADHGHPIRDPQGEYRIVCDWTLAIDAHQAIGGKLGASAVVSAIGGQACVCANSDSTWVMCPVHGYQKIDREPVECTCASTDETATICPAHGYQPPECVPTCPKHPDCPCGDAVAAKVVRGEIAWTGADEPTEEIVLGEMLDGRKITGFRDAEVGEPIDLGVSA